MYKSIKIRAFVKIIRNITFGIPVAKYCAKVKKP